MAVGRFMISECSEMLLWLLGGRHIVPVLKHFAVIYMFSVRKSTGF